jgi:hypothetical protein
MRLTLVGLVCGILAAGIAGCDMGGPKYAPTSGIVSVNGEPYGKAVVSFQPIATNGNPNPGRGSSGYTDDTGRFILQTDDGHDGAVVGKHRVRIMTTGNDVVAGYDPALGSPDGYQQQAAPRQRIDPIPPEWNATSEHEFAVPVGGTDAANFDIITRRQ